MQPSRWGSPIARRQSARNHEDRIARTRKAQKKHACQVQRITHVYLVKHHLESLSSRLLYAMDAAQLKGQYFVREMIECNSHVDSTHEPSFKAAKILARELRKAGYTVKFLRTSTRDELYELMWVHTIEVSWKTQS